MKIKDINIYYEQYGKKGSQDLVLLHGWGQNTQMMNPIGNSFADDFFIANIDLPGFGKSDEPLICENLNDYYLIIKELLDKLKINNPIIVGHSFGGKLAIMHASKEKVKKLVLLASPFRKSDKKPLLRVRILKHLAKLSFLNPLVQKMKSKLGSTDYRNASVMMRKVLIQTLGNDLTENLKDIKAPTLLIWGELDTAVSLEDAKYAEKAIPDAGLIIYENRTHYAYLEELNRTNIILKEFFKEK